MKQQIPSTVCPLSNVKLGVFADMHQHNLKQMLNLNLFITVNPEDPAYFGNYIEKNLRALHEASGLDPQDIYKLSRNSFQVSFLNPAGKKILERIE